MAENTYDRPSDAASRSGADQAAQGMGPPAQKPGQSSTDYQNEVIGWQSAQTKK